MARGPFKHLAERLAQCIDDLICARIEEHASTDKFGELAEVSEDCLRRLGEVLGEAIISNPEDR